MCVKHFEELLDEIFSQFSSEGEKANGGHGYLGVDLAGYGSCTWRGYDVLVHLPGRAMEFLRYYLKIPDQQTCRWFLERGFKATRLDCAMDSADKALNPRVVVEYWQKDLVSCAAQLCDFQPTGRRKGQRLMPKDGAGMTTYVGSRKAEKFLRVYDKKTEALRNSGEIVTDEHGNELEHLTRLELQHRRDHAQAVAEKIAECGVDVIRKLIAGYISFLSAYDSRLKRNKRVARWWRRIAGDECQYVPLLRGTATPDDSIAWIERQGVATLKLMRSKAPELWKRLLEEKLSDYEVRPLKEKLWDAWARGRAERKAELAEIERVEREEEVVAEMERERRDAARTVVGIRGGADAAA
jgi:hypothetical protein